MRKGNSNSGTQYKECGRSSSTKQPVMSSTEITLGDTPAPFTFHSIYTVVDLICSLRFRYNLYRY